MNTELKKTAKNDFGKDFFKLMNNTVFGKSMENMRKHRDIKLVTTEKRRNFLVSEPNYHTIINYHSIIILCYHTNCHIILFHRKFSSYRNKIN